MFCPIMVDISNKKILIVGGGKIAYRKAKNLLKYGANILVVSLEFTSEFSELNREYEGRISLIEDSYNKKYLRDSFLVVAATSLREVNKQVSIDSKELDIPSNIVDNQEESSFISPGVVNDEGLVISISTGGRFPYLNKLVKEDLKTRYAKYNNEYMDLLGDLRKLVLANYKDKSREIFAHALELEEGELKKFIIKIKDEIIGKESQA